MTKRTTIRMPDKLRKEIKQLAAKQDRSMNNMIIFMLKNAVDEVKAKGK